MNCGYDPSITHLIQVNNTSGKVLNFVTLDDSQIVANPTYYHPSQLSTHKANVSVHLLECHQKLYLRSFSSSVDLKAARITAILEVKNPSAPARSS